MDRLKQEVAHFAAKALHMHIHGAAFARAQVIPGRVQQPVPAEHVTGVIGQRHEQAEFLRRQAAGAAVHIHLALRFTQRDDRAAAGFGFRFGQQFCHFCHLSTLYDARQQQNVAEK